MSQKNYSWILLDLCWPSLIILDHMNLFFCQKWKNGPSAPNDPKLYKQSKMVQTVPNCPFRTITTKGVSSPKNSTKAIFQGHPLCDPDFGQVLWIFFLNSKRHNQGKYQYKCILSLTGVNHSCKDCLSSGSCLFEWVCAVLTDISSEHLIKPSHKHTDPHSRQVNKGSHIVCSFDGRSTYDEGD